MLKKIFIILLFAFSTNMQGQIIKMRTTEISSKIGDGDWSDWNKFETLIIINGDLKKITIYSEPKEVYEIISAKNPKNEHGVIAAFKCVDKEGEECIIAVVEDEQKSQLYIHYDNAVLIINFNPI